MQRIRRNSICCLKNQAIFHRVSTEIGLTPPLSLFVYIHSLRTPSPLHNKPFIKKGLLEEIEGVNDNASGFMHVNIKQINNGKKLLFNPNLAGKRKFKSSGIGTYLSRWVCFQRFAPGSNK